MASEERGHALRHRRRPLQVQQVGERFRAANDQMMAGGGNGLWKAFLSPGESVAA